MSSLLQLEADILWNWGSLNSNKGGSIRLSMVNIARVLDVVKQQKYEEKLEIIKVGRLEVGGIGNSKKRRRFIFCSVDDEEIFGSISTELVNNQKINITLGKLSKVVIEKTLKTKSTGEVITEYMLLDIQDLKQ